MTSFGKGITMSDRSIVVISAGLSQPSSTRLLADRLADATVTELAARGITEPFRIQTLVLPDALEGRDILAKAPTGSGKTLGFGIPLVERTPAEGKTPTSLVLVPTRELALQVRAEWAG